MNVLVIGSGGREHALAWKLKQSPQVTAIHCAPGNPGMAQLGQCHDVAVNDFEGLMALAKEQAVDLVVVGPEDPLAAGIVDAFEAIGIKAFGPSKAAAQLEGSKAFAKQIMAKYNIPTAAYQEFDNAEDAKAYIREQGVPIVIKADGLAAGKGVTVAHDLNQALAAIDAAMVEECFGDAGARVVVEAYLEGEEASILAFCDGMNVLPLATSQDHKPAFDGDKGPNTGGMGAYSPAPVVNDVLFAQIERDVLQRCVDGMAAEGIPYKGLLYAGLMITNSGPMVIEFNCRFGDPETQVVLPRMKSDILPLFLASIDRSLDKVQLEWHDESCVTVVLASGGYPGAYAKGKAICGIEEAEATGNVTVFHAGTRQEGDSLVTNGGRVLNVTGTGPDIAAAIAITYAALPHISFEGAMYRTDIGQKALARLESQRMG